MGRQTQPSGREDPLDVHDYSGAHQTQKALSGLEGCARNQRLTRGIGKFHVSIEVWKTTSGVDGELIEHVSRQGHLPEISVFGIEDRYRLRAVEDRKVGAWHGGA